jgi:amidophosphoribosyltransferase
MDNLIDECGIIGSVSFKGENVFPYIYWGLVALNHRGQQSYGILSYEGEFKIRKGLGLISELNIEHFKKLSGSIGIGHVRYATSGKLDKFQLLEDAQPYLIMKDGIRFAIAYNGNIVNVFLLRKKFSLMDVNFIGTSDTTLLAYEILEAYKKYGNLIESIKDVMKNVDGAYSVVGIIEGNLFAFRDPNGIRPLVLGYNDDVLMIASESVALDINRIPFMGFVNPGELIIVDKDAKIRRYKLINNSGERLCAFEYAYFSRPDSKLLEGKYIYQVRRELGRRLARRYSEIASKVDIIVPVPQTAIDAAYGFHEESKKPIEPIIIRNRYITQRAFIMTPNDRELIISKKYNILLDSVDGLKVALIDDSIVRGDTLKRIVYCLRQAGVKEIHIFSTFPKIIAPCFYGIDMATFHELIGFNKDEKEIASLLGADSVNYQTIEDFYHAVGNKSLCLACVTMKYPTSYAQKIAEKAYLEASKGYMIHGRIIENVGE